MEKYEENLFGKIEFLHEKMLSEVNKLNIFSDMIIKYQISLINFAKSIETIKSLNTDIISEKNNSIGLTLENLKQAIKSHLLEFKECATHMKTIIEPLIKSKEEKNSVEKEMFNQYNKFKSLYNNLKSNCEKAKKEYNISAKFCESSIHNLIQYKSNSLNNKNNNDPEINRLEEKMQLSITNTKTLEEKYIRSIDEANKVRVNMVNKEEELLKYYQKINYEFYNKISCAIIYIIPILKKMFSSILLELNSTEKLCQKMDIQNDINIFIKNNSIDAIQEKPILFEPYIPRAELRTASISGKDKKDLDNLDINYEIIEILKKNFKDIRTDLNMELEQKKYRLRFLCNEIFKIGPGVGFTLKEKEELISLIKEPKCKSFFLITLSKQRTKGRFKRSEKLVKELVDILINILDSSEENNDYQNAKNCIILSETFYYEKEKNKKDEDNKKIFIIDYIRYYKWFQNIDFWEGIIESMIQGEINNNERINKKLKRKETLEEIEIKICNIAFGILLSYTNTMIEFNISKEDINKIVDTFVEKYNIEEDKAKTIYDNIESAPLPEIDEENKKIFEEMLNNYEINKNNNIDNEEENIEIQEEDNNIKKKKNEIIENNNENEINIKNNEEKMNIEEENGDIEEEPKNEIGDHNGEDEQNGIENDA